MNSNNPSLIDIDPFVTPLALWHPDCLEGVPEEVKINSKKTHAGIVALFELLHSHPYASGIPVYTSIATFCIGGKKDIISLFYSYDENQIRMVYSFSDGRDIIYEGSPEEALDKASEYLDLFVRRHKRMTITS